MKRIIGVALLLTGCAGGAGQPAQTVTTPTSQIIRGDVVTYNLLHQYGDTTDAQICIAPADQGIAMDAQMVIKDGATGEPRATPELGLGKPRKFLSEPGHSLCAFPFEALVPARNSYELTLAGQSMVVMAADTSAVEWDRKVT